MAALDPNTSTRCPRCDTRLPRERFLACPRCLLEGELEPELLAGRYRLEGLVGRGGVGLVHRARDLRTGKTVALKVLDEEWAGVPEQEQRFEREARALRRLHHPGIVGFRDYGRDEGRAFLVMELVEGQPLQALLPLGPGRVVPLFLQICQALAHAHARGLVHRDLKPGNILVDPYGRVKLLDFGIAAAVGAHVDARLTVGAQAVGTADYMAPEARLGAEPDPRQDVYALGVILYELLMGRLPLGCFELPPPPFASVVAKALSPDPARRQASVLALQRELEPERESLPPEERLRAVAVASALALSSMLALAVPGRALETSGVALWLPLALAVLLSAVADLHRRALLLRWRELGFADSEAEPVWCSREGVLVLATLAFSALLLQVAPAAVRGPFATQVAALVEFVALSVVFMRVLELQRRGCPVGRDPSLAVAAGLLLLGAFLPLLTAALS